MRAWGWSKYNNRKQEFVFFTYPSLQIHCTENFKNIFPERKLCGLCPYFYIHMFVSDLHTPTIGLPIWLQEIGGPIVGIYKSLTVI
jgi:hypothetical protein